MKILKLIVLLGWFSSVYAQTITIEGRILDASTNQPVPFAGVGIVGKSIGTVANEQGRFILKLNEQYASDMLIVNCMGFESYQVSVKSAMQSGPLEIKLKVNVIRLQEVVVKPINPTEIIYQAVALIPENYDKSPSIIEGFYRESVKQTNTNHFFAFSEGVIQLYKSGVDTNTPDLARMIKGRKKELPTQIITVQNDTCPVPRITNGPYLGYFLDVVRARDFPLYDLNSYTFEYDGVQTIGTTFLYKIKFKNNPVVRRSFNQRFAAYKGTIYIETESLAVVKAEYELTAEALHQYELNTPGIRLKNRKYIINYAPFEGKWYLHDARVVNDFQYDYYAWPKGTRPKNAPKRIDVGVGLYNQMAFVTTHISNRNLQQFPANQILKIDASFTEQSMTFEDDFWKDFNIIEEDEN
ncbi:carboxypeptidase-like regulatory domain-containing protein [Runella sp.]|uniref:carboxypeptidase-like regulatory domain-containing protein n=1 Tax=Runella sp. TaxID=1960881 RepID=UPI003D0ADF99